LEKLIKEQLTSEECKLFDSTIGLVEASIGRMVPVMTPEMQGDNILRICVEEYGQLPVDKEAFKGEIPQIHNMVPFAPFGFYIQRKLFMHNMGHAVTAYLGNLESLKYIWEAQGCPAIKLIALKALQESAVAMSEEHNVKLYTILQHAEDLIYRFGNKLLGDTIERVGKDPVRKLSDNDRLTGASKLCIKHGILPVYISIGIAAAFMFKPEKDEAAARVQQVLESQGIEAAIQNFCSLEPSNEISKLTVGFYNMMKAGSNLEEIILKAEKIKSNYAKV
jgi:mannitol-1-phosphate 5-dehydrogenase